MTGTARLYADGIFQFADGKARLMALEWADNNEKPDTDFPFWLNSGRVVEHFHTRTRTGKVGNCNKYSPTAYMEINTDAAWELGIEQMEYVRLVSRGAMRWSWRNSPSVCLTTWCLSPFIFTTVSTACRWAC